MRELPPAAGFWGALPGPDADGLRALGRVSQFGRGAALCTEGEPATHVFVLLTGWVKILNTTREGAEVLLALRGQGDVVGERAAELEGYRTATARALVRTEALAVISGRFRAFLDSHPAADRAFRHAMTQRGREADEALRARAGSSGAERLARLLLDLSARCGEATEQGVTIAVPLSQADLASWIGVARATVTRALQQWRRRGLIRTVRGRLTVADASGLRRAAGLPPPGAGDW